MAQTDAFALQNSSFNPFLFAAVGPELNGSTLTVLSVLARLDEDPWSIAESWSRLPGPTVIDRLAERIRRMPLDPQALTEARSTASRLALLLPGKSGSGVAASGPARSKSARVAVIYGVVAIALAMNMMMGLAYQEKPSAAPPHSTTQTPTTDATSR
jgi:hypothetical protein